MIFDLLFLGFAIAALVTGYKNGLIKTILRGVLFIAGGIAAMYFVVERNQSGWLIVAIIAGTYAGAFVGTIVAKSLRLTIVRGPLRLADSLLGAALEVSNTYCSSSLSEQFWFIRLGIQVKAKLLRARYIPNSMKERQPSFLRSASR